MAFASPAIIEKKKLILMGAGGSFKTRVCDYIIDSTLLSDLTHDDAMIMAEWVKAYEVSKGTEIITEGEKSPCLCILSEGRLDVFKETSSYERKKVATILPGRSFGEMGVIDGRPHSATVIASENSIILLITATNFKQLVEDHPSLGNKLLYSIARMMSLRLRQTTGQLADYIEK